VTDCKNIVADGFKFALLRKKGAFEAIRDTEHPSKPVKPSKSRFGESQTLAQKSKKDGSPL
jgi:hypothetical protein